MSSTEEPIGGEKGTFFFGILYFPAHHRKEGGVGGPKKKKKAAAAIALLRFSVQIPTEGKGEKKKRGGTKRTGCEGGDPSGTLTLTSLSLQRFVTKMGKKGKRGDAWAISWG